jgi:hypothetical protein
MNVSVPPRRRDAAGNRGIHDRVACRARHLGQAPRGGDIDGGAIDQQGAGWGRADHLVFDHVTHDCPVGQHRHHHVGACHGIGHGGTGRAARFLRGSERGRGQIERAHLVARLGEVGGHAAAHVAQANECNCRHGSLSRCKRCWY